MRSTRLETVRARHVASLACKPSVGSCAARRVPDGAPLHCERHRPEQTTRYRLVRQHAASFIEHTEASTDAELPGFVKDEFDAFLECGILAYGFLRLRCGECGHDKLLAQQPQAPRVLSLMRCAAQVAEGSAPGRPRHPPRAGAPVGAVAADPARACCWPCSPSC
jgi:hypothetical protein